MATDQATADYEAEQEAREKIQDDSARERSLAQDNLAHASDPPPQPLCAQCVNWEQPRTLHLTEGTTRLRPGYCAIRAAADLSQMSQAHAQQCDLYEVDIPF